jgi:PAS domain S-box-containing protein
MNNPWIARRSWLGYAGGVLLLLVPVPLTALFPGQACLYALGFGVLGTAWLTLHGWWIHRDIQRTLREYHRQEARLEALVDSAADAILTCDSHGIIRSANTSASQLFGYPREEMLGLSIMSLIPTESLSAVQTDQQQVLGVVTAYRGKRRDGTTFPITLAMSKVRLPEEALFSVIIHDQTALAQARDEAEAANRAKSAFLLTASHELRTPLTAILGTVEILAQTPLGTEQRQLLRTLSESSEGLFGLVQQILDYSQIEMGQLRLKMGVFSLRRMVNELEERLTPLARAKGISFRVQTTTPLPTGLLGDGDRFRQILECLLRNAIQYTLHGHVSLLVRADQNHVRVTIEDTGPGIALADQERIFAAFERANLTSGGLGLGLTVAAQLTRLMGGKLQLHSEPNRGCRIQLQFSFVLPPLHPRPVLVALPDAALRARIEASLAEIGIEPIGVPTGRKALAEVMRSAVQGRAFELVVLDNSLPDIDTEQWLQQAKECSGWEGAVVLLGDDPSSDPCLERVISLHRDQATVPLCELLRQQLRPVAAS